MTHIYECFPFYDEIELLRIRFEELSSIVTKFIIIEGTHTHQGDPKPLHFLKNRSKFEAWNRQIVHLVAQLPSREQLHPETKGAWQGENIQRDYALNWLKQNANPTDIVIFSDADEIISHKAVEEYYHKVLRGQDGIHSVSGTWHEYYLNNRRYAWVKGEQEGWTNGIKIGTWENFRGILPNRIRYEFFPQVHGSWHFSAMGVPEALQKKVTSYAHEEFNKHWIREGTFITRQAQLGYSVFHGDHTLERCEIDDSFPKYVRDNIEHYEQLGWINHYTPPVVEMVLDKTGSGPKEVSIVIPTLNHVDDLLRKCVDSILRYSSLDRLEIIIVANGCTDGTREYVESLDAPVKLLWCDRPLGFTVATNEGICAARGDYIILQNNDTEILPCPTDSWINWLIDPMKNDPKVGMTGPHDLVDHQTKVRFLVFFLAAIRRSLFEEIGLLDEIFTPGFGEDMDLCVRAERAGYTVLGIDPGATPMEGSEKVVVGKFPIWHPADVTVEEIPNWNLIHKRNQEIVEERKNSNWAYPKGQIREYTRKYG